MRSPVPTALILLLTLGAVFPHPGSAQAPAPTITPHGELRLRGEADARTANFGDDMATLSRIRFGARAELMPWVRAFIQLQDSRAWGTETNTLTDASADQLDLHQGYVELDALGFTGRLGRQELLLGDERLVGAVGWTNTARSFDGAVIWRTIGKAEVRGFWMNVAERDALLATGLDPQANQGFDDDGWLLGSWASVPAGPATVELTLLHDRNAATDESWTAGARVHSRQGPILVEAAGAYQFGPDRAAYFLSGKLGTVVGKGSVAAQVDWLSGDDDLIDAERTAFTTLYATNHKFYGYMDYFLALPAQTGQAGLVDAMARLTVPLPQQWRVRGDLHYFRTHRALAGETFLGVEGDVVVDRPLGKYAGLEIGGSVFSPGDLAATLLPAFARGTDEATWWGYVQLTVRWP
ncbi:MAG: alginate export family protein [Gemmatimonadota bacterium]|nr:alginate export family protein [Gemmatimonadota bacterium]